jgi:predicted DNA binding CopG/RHH family protein
MYAQEPQRIGEKGMKAEYDFSKGRRGQAVPTKGKTRITMYIDDQILAAFKAESARTGIGYQTLINQALGQQVGVTAKPITADQVRKIVREELSHSR